MSTSNNFTPIRDKNFRSICWSCGATIRHHIREGMIDFMPYPHKGGNTTSGNFPGQ